MKHFLIYGAVLVICSLNHAATEEHINCVITYREIGKVYTEDANDPLYIPYQFSPKSIVYD